MKPHVQALCDKLVANDLALTEVEIVLSVFSDDEDLDLVFDATKKNHTLEKLTIRGGVCDVCFGPYGALRDK